MTPFFQIFQSFLCVYWEYMRNKKIERQWQRVFSTDGIPFLTETFPFQRDNASRTFPMYFSLTYNKIE